MVKARSIWVFRVRYHRHSSLLGQSFQLRSRTDLPDYISDLRSDDFDAYLHIVGPGLNEPVANDDGAGGTDSRLEFEFPETGRYVIIVNTYGGNETGKFTLSVRD